MSHRLAWLRGRERNDHCTRLGRARRPGVDPLEDRRLLSITFQFNYSYDAAGYFATHPQSEALLQAAGEQLGARLENSLAAITPDPAAGNTWSATFSNPSNPSTQVTLNNLSIAANTLLVFVGTSVGSYGGLGGPGGWGSSGSTDWNNLVASRGQTQALSSPPHGFGPWGGMVTFNVSNGQAPDFAVMLHELVHVLGVGTAESWFADVNTATNQFIGPNAEAAYGGPVPLDTATGDAHWATGTQSGGIAALMTEYADIQQVTPLDWAGLEDVGWQLASPELAVSVSALTPAGAPLGSFTFGQSGVLVATGAVGFSGTITFISGSTLLGSSPVSSAGRASISLAAVPAGVQTIAAVEVATNASGASDSGWSLLNLTVNPAQPVLHLADPGGPYNGIPYTASATITGVDGQAGSSLEGVAVQVSYFDPATGANLVSAPVGPGHYGAIAYFPGSADYLTATKLIYFKITTGSTPPPTRQAAAAIPDAPIPRFHGRRLKAIVLPVQFLSAAAGLPAPGGIAVYEIVTHPKRPRQKPRVKVLDRAPIAGGVAAPSFPLFQVVGKPITVIYSGDARYLPLTLSLPVLARAQLHALARR